MLNFFRPMLSRVIGAWVAALAVWLSAKAGFVLDDNAQEQIIAGGVAVALAVFQTVYALAHRTIDKRVNPGDAASSHLAAAEAKATAELKARAGP
jgi:hypothetical protein